MTDGTSHWHECSRCDEINDKANHSGGTATCIALAKCEICGVEYGDLAEHVYVENAEEQYLVSAATCTAKATYYKSCSVCGEAGEEVFEYGEPLGHEYGEPEWTWEGYTSATATFTCTRGCGDKQTATASGSSITNVVTTPAECETEGLRTYTAKVMFGGKEYVATTTETIPALEHVEDEAVRENEVPASCTAAGSYDEVVYCSVCGEELSREEKVIDALGHSFTSYVSDNNATCTEDGTETAKCDRCEVTDTRTDEGSALGHDWAEAWTTDGTAHWHECSRCDEINDKASHSGGEATCTSPAECEVCGAEYGESLGHDFEHHEAKPATCTETGWDAYDTCSRCDYTTYVEIEALGHDWAKEWTTDGTAHWHECSRCDEINDKANHSGGEATCTNPAECEVCGAAYGDAIGHTESEAVRENEVPASCTTAGSYDEVIYCSVCGEELSREGKVIDALGHSFTNYVSDNNATCTEDGTETAKCDRCEVTDTRTDEGSALGHDWAEEWTTDGTAHWHECSRCDEINDKASHSGGTATCTNPAECEVCGAAYGEALGHDLEHHEAKPATCTENGWDAYDTCTRCDYTTYVEIAAKGHTFGPDATCTEDQVCLECGEVISAATGHIPGSDATCTENQTCSVCGEILTPALGHSFTSYISDNNATCTEDGTETAKCDRCEVTDTRTDEGSALGHDLEHHEAKPATCTQNGWNAYETCNRAGCAYTTYREISATGHTPSAAATCTTPQTCTVCGATLVEALGHSFVDGYCTTCGVSDEEALENDREDAKTDLDDVAQDVKDEIDASDLPDDVKEDLKDKVDEIINGAKDEVDGSTDFDDVNQAVEDARQEIEDAILNTEKDDAKSDLDEIVQNAKDEIDASDLPDDVKDDLKDKVDEIVDGAKDEVDGSTDFDDVDQAIEDAKDEIEDAILDAEKDDAKSDLDEIAQGAKDEVDGSDLPDDVKDDLKGKVDEIVNDAKAEIDGETSKEEVDQTVEDAQKETEDAILNAEKDDAKSDLDEIAQSAKDEIDASDLPDDVKDELKGKVDAAVEEAKEAIDNATSKEEVENIVNDTREDIDDLLKGGLDNELAEKKDTAISDLTEIAQGAKDEIAGSDVSDEEKDELKGKVDEIVNEAKAEIEAATAPEEIDEILAEAENEIAAVTEGLKAGQLNTSTLWPWIIVAIVISAALSTLFAWRHVKKVQGKGEAVGAKSVVTIAVATILIFVVVIGITLLIFAMV